MAQINTRTIMLKWVNKFTMVSDYKETVEIIYNKHPKSSYCCGWNDNRRRVLSYLELYWFARNNSNYYWISGPKGTQGRKLLEGAQDIKIRGKYYELKYCRD